MRLVSIYAPCTCSSKEALQLKPGYEYYRLHFGGCDMLKRFWKNGPDGKLLGIDADGICLNVLNNIFIILVIK